MSKARKNDLRIAVTLLILCLTVSSSSVLGMESTSFSTMIASSGTISYNPPLPILTPIPTLGNSVIGTYKDQNDPNAQSISYFKATTTGSITDIIAYISGASSGNAKAALYAANGNTPGALLAQSNSVNIGTTYSWIDFQLTTPYTATIGTTYGLAMMGNVPVNLALVPGTGQRTGGPGDGSYTNGFTNPFGTVWFNDLTGTMSIYATSTSPSTPVPAPPPAPISEDGINYALMPNYWAFDHPYATLDSSVKAPSGADSIKVVSNNIDIGNGFPGDSEVEMYGPCNPTYGTGNLANELNGHSWGGGGIYTVVGGEHVVFSVWIKTTSRSGYDGNIAFGGEIGIDMVTTGGFISWVPGVASPYYANFRDYFVPWGTSTVDKNNNGYNSSSDCWGIQCLWDCSVDSNGSFWWR